MANGGSIKYSIGFNVDKSGLTELRQSFQELKSMTSQQWQLLNPGKDVAEFDKIKASIKEVDLAFNSAFNKDLGTLNISKFNQSLSNSKLTIQQVYANLSTMGTAGQTAFRNLTTQLLTTNIKLKETHSLLNSMATTMANTIKWGAASSAMNSFTGTVQKAYGYVKNLDSSLNDIRIVTGKSADEMDKFAEKANKAAKNLGQTTTNYTDAALIYYQQGLSDEEAAARAEVTLKAANVTGQSGAEVSEQLTAVWNGYKVTAEEAELYIDKLAAVAATTAADLEELSTGMSKVASAANLMGVDVDQLNAQLATIVSVTRQAPESVGTALKTIYARMGDIEAGLDSETTLGDYTEKMAAMGINVLDMNGQLRDMGEVMEEIGGKWTSMSREQQVYLSQVMAGTRQYNNLLSLFDNWDQYTKALETSSNAAGTLQNQQNTYMESTEAHLKQLKASWEDLYDSLLNGESINNMVDGLTKVVSLTADFTDGIGGGGNLLLSLGSTATIVFSKQIAQGLATTIKNFQNAKWNAAQLAAQLDILKQYQKFSLGDDGTKQIVKMKKDVIDLGNVLSAEQANEANIMMKNTAEIYEEQAAWKAKTDEVDAYIKKIKGLEGVKTIVGVQGPKQEGNKTTPGDENYQKINKTLTEQIKTFDQLGKTQKKNIEFSNNLNAAAGKYLKTSKGNTEATKNWNQVVQEATKRVGTIEGNLKKLKGAVDENSQEYQEASAAVTAYYAALKKGDPEEIANTFKQASQKMEVLANKGGEVGRRMRDDFLAEANGMSNGFSQAIERAKKSWEQFVNNSKKVQIIQQSLQIVGAIGQIASGLQSLSNISNILENDSLSAGEKALQIISALTMATTMLASGGMNLFKSTITLAGALGGEAAAAMADAEAKGLATVSTKIFGLAVKDLAGKIGGMLSTIAPYILAIGALVAVIYACVKAYNADADAAKEAAETAKAAADAATEAKQAYEDLKNTLNEYDDIVQNLKELKEGTDEYTEALQKANEKVMDLINSHSELAQYVDRDDRGLLYFKEGYEEVLQNAKNRSDSAQATAQAAKTSANIAQLKSDRTNFIRDYGIGVTQRKEDLSTPVENKTGPGGAFAYIKGEQAQTKTVNLSESYDISNDELKRIVDFINEKNGKYTSEELSNFISKELGYSSTQADELIKVLEKAPLKELAKNTAELEATNKLLLEESMRASLEENDQYAKMDEAEKNAVASLYSEDFSEEERARLEKEAKDKWYKDDWFGAGNEDDVHKAYMKAMGYTGVTDKMGDKAVYTKEDGTTVTVDDDAARNHLVQQEVAKNMANYNEENLNNIMSGIEKISGNNEGFQDILMNYTGDQKLDASTLTAEQARALKNALESGDINVSELSPEEWAALGIEDGEAFLGGLEQELNNFDWANAYGNSVAQFERNIGVASEALDSLREGTELEEDALRELESTFPELGKIWDKNSREYIEALEHIKEEQEDLFQKNKAEKLVLSGDEAEKALKDYEKTLKEYQEASGDDKEKLKIELEADTDTMIAQLEEVFQERYELEIAITDDILTDIDNVVSATENLQTAAAAIGDGFKLAAEDSKELFAIFPELAHNAEVLADGTIQLNEDVVTSVLGGYDLEIAGNKQVLKEKIKDRIQELENAKAAAEEKLAAVQSAGEGELDIQAILGESYADFQNFQIETNKNATNDEVMNNANATKAIITNWGAKEKAAIDYATTAAAAGKAEETGIVPSARISGADQYGVTSEVETQNTTQKVDQDPEKEAREKMRNAVEGYLNNQIDSYEKQIADLTIGLANMNYETTTGMADSFKEGNEKRNKGSGSGKDKEKEKDIMELAEDERDIYHDINYELEQINKKLSKQERITSKLTGKDRIKSLKEESKLLDDQISKEQSKLALLENESKALKDKLSKDGVEFDEEGDIVNFNAALDQKLAALNQAIAAYNALDAEAQTDAEKAKVEAARAAYEQFKADMEHYEEIILNEIPEVQDAINEAFDKQIELQIEAMEIEIELKLDLQDAKRQLEEFLSDVFVEDDDYLGKQQYIVNQIPTYLEDETGTVATNQSAWSKALQAYETIKAGGIDDVYGDDAAKAWEDVLKYQDATTDAIRDAKVALEEVEQLYLDGIDAANEAFDEHLEKYEDINDELEHYLKVTELLKGEEAYEEQIAYYDQMEKNNIAKMEFLRGEVAFWEDRMAKEEEGSEAWKKAQENAIAAQKELNSLVEESIEIAQNKFEATVKSIMKSIADAATDGMGLDYVKEQWELINEEADMYLDKINGAYEIGKLESKMLKALDNTSSVKSRERISELMNDELGKLREKDKLSQYEVDRANALFDLELKKIALEEAQRNKSTMRLRRDSQGNYTYQYTSDSDAIADAQAEVDEAQNALYNLDLDAYKDNLDKSLELFDEWQAKRQEIMIKYAGDEEKMKEQLALIDKEYEDMITFNTEQNEIIRQNLQQSTFGSLAEMRDLDIEDFNNMTLEEQRIIMESMVPFWNSGVQAMTDKFTGKDDSFIEVCEAGFIRLNEATQAYKTSLDAIGEAAGVDFEAISSGQQTVLEEIQQLQTENGVLFDQYDETLGKLRENVEVTKEWVEKLQEVAREAENAMNKVIALQQQEIDNLGGGSGDSSSSSNGNVSSNKNSSNSNSRNNSNSNSKSENNGKTSPSADVNPKVEPEVNPEVDRRPPYYYTTLDGKTVSIYFRDKKSLAARMSIDALLNHPVYKSATRFKTGGYTGSWANGDTDGRLAFLHQKELVLNAKDTANILDAVNLVRGLEDSLNSRMFNLTNASALDKLYNLLEEKLSKEETAPMEQNIHIEANFPGVSVEKEISDAFDNLITKMSQKMYSTKR